jgi:hypothetical protein
VATVVALAGAVTAAGQFPLAPAGAAIEPATTITNGRVTLGVNPEGDLNAEDIGITFEPTGNDGIAAGCECEGWGVGDATTMVSGSAGRSFGVTDVEVELFEAEADRAVSTVLVPSAADPTFRVTHDYRPSVSPDLYEVEVTLENLSDAPVVPRYRRAMDWDIPPTVFDEYVTIQGTEASSSVIFASDDGFADGDPFAGESWINFTGDAVDNYQDVLTPGGDGPDSDHGALFDFEFAPLDPGASSSFRIYYGASATEAEANAALGAIGAEVYSFGQPSSEGGPDLGTPNTFIFAFAGVGGLVQFPTIEYASPTFEGAEGTDAEIKVNLSGPTAQEVRVDYATAAGTATPGDDYTETAGTLVIPVGASAGTFTVPLVDDGIADAGETVNLSLANPVGGEIGAQATAVLTILDPPPQGPGNPPQVTATPTPVAATPVAARPPNTG